MGGQNQPSRSISKNSTTKNPVEEYSEKKRYTNRTHTKTRRYTQYYIIEDI